jgi:DNA-binding transcriptional ArsR family regulator
MEDSVMIEALGDAVNLRILSFFLENPFDSYTVSQISQFAEVSRNSVYQYTPIFLEKKYLTKEKKGSREVYKLNRSNKIVKLLDRFVDEVGDIHLQPLIERENMSTRKLQLEKTGCQEQPFQSNAAA